MKKINSDKVFGFTVYAVLILITFVILYPLYFTVIASFSEPKYVATGQVVLWPKGFSVEGYAEVFKSKDIWLGYKNTIMNTIGGTLFSLFLTIPTGYALSKRKMQGRGIISFYFLFTMYFGGGMLPFYLLMKELGLINKPYTMMIMGGMSVYYVVITRTYFSNSIPESLYEATEIDGGTEFDCFFKIALPLAKPIISVIALYYAIGQWNGYFTALLYASKKELKPLQLVLREVLILGQSMLQTVDINLLTDEELNYYIERAQLAEAMKYSVIFIGSLPMLIAYPFVQKYFVKGVMIGSVKG